MRVDERTVGVGDALKIAVSWAVLHNLNINYEIVCASEATRSITVSSALVDSEGKRLSQASGKGYGDASIASAVFEAIEHAAISQKLPGQKPDNHDYVFVDNDENRIVRPWIRAS
ncbi:hypothetical protein [Actinomyces vulturis]|uniref:hypothetical protein n=1 Tax=Actinomyces vulturis TaxID=1857645 RepID=UPI00159ED990|nr:hypothetical protein [Actinomyces vulturis]